jgi:acylphosphatase
MQKAFLVRFFGRVQGVGFRFLVLRLASKAGVNGWVRNSWENDLVEAYFLGEEKKVLQLIEELKKPAYWIRVDNIVVEEAPVEKYLKGFEVKY